MPLQLFDIGQEMSYIDIEPAKVPYTFSVKLQDKTFTFAIKHNSEANFFTVDLETSIGEILAYGDAIRYGRPLFGNIEDERFPQPAIVPLCLTGDRVDTVTFENLGREVKLYLFERRAT